MAKIPDSLKEGFNLFFERALRSAGDSGRVGSNFDWASLMNQDSPSGTATLSGGTVTVNTSAVTATSKIMLCHKGTTMANAGHLSVGAIVAGTSFVINSTNGADTDVVTWEIID